MNIFTWFREFFKEPPAIEPIQDKEDIECLNGWYGCVANGYGVRQCAGAKRTYECALHNV